MYNMCVLFVLKLNEIHTDLINNAYEILRKINFRYSVQVTRDVVKWKRLISMNGWTFRPLFLLNIIEKKIVVEGSRVFNAVSKNRLSNVENALNQSIRIKIYQISQCNILKSSSTDWNHKLDI